MFTDTFGVKISLKLGVPLTGATSAEVVVKSPDGQRNVKASTVTITDVTQGIVQYVTESGDIARKGTYELQAIVYVGVAAKYRSEIVEIEVDQAL